jgi:hypothetical protein
MPPLYRRNFLPTIIIDFLLWITCGLIIFFLDPQNFSNIVLFFVFLTLALTLTFALLFANTRRGFLFALLLTGSLLLRFLKTFNWFTFFPIFFVLLSAEIYFLKKFNR